MANKVYEYVTENIIKQLEEGTIPWQRPWRNGIPINYVSRRPYRGVNLFLLPTGGEYLTFNQVKKLGGSVKKGAKAHMVIFWKPIEYEKETKTSTGENEVEKVIIPYLRYYRVFHLSDTEGIPSKLKPIENDPIESAEKILREYTEVPIVHKENSAYYSPKKDFINVPDINQFPQVEEYYCTAFHEIVHSTGHESRLKRFLSTDACIFGSQTYSFEELVAELGASMLCGVSGIEQVTIKNSASYIAGWLSKLKDDRSLIVKASVQAQRACDYVLKTADEKEEFDDESEVA
jgi:antirestriction protein ArdC